MTYSFYRDIFLFRVSKGADGAWKAFADVSTYYRLENGAINNVCMVAQLPCLKVKKDFFL